MSYSALVNIIIGFLVTNDNQFLQNYLLSRTYSYLIIIIIIIIIIIRRRRRRRRRHMVYVQENETYKLLRNSEVQTDHLNLARRPGPIILNNKKEYLVNSVLSVLADHKVKLKKTKTKISNRTLLGNLEKTMEHESDGDTNCNWCTRYSHQRIGTRTRRLVNKKMSGHHPNESIKIGQNIEKNSKDLRFCLA